MATDDDTMLAIAKSPTRKFSIADIMQSFAQGGKLSPRRLQLMGQSIVDIATNATQAVMIPPSLARKDGDTNSAQAGASTSKAAALEVGPSKLFGANNGWATGGY